MDSNKKMFNEEEYFNLIKTNPAKKVCIFGAGNYGRILLGLCRENRVKIDMICVSDISRNRSDIDGIPVVSFLSIDEADKDLLILLAVNGKRGNEVKEYVEANGRFNYIPFPQWLTDHDLIDKRRYESPIIEITPSIGCKIQCRYCPQAMLLKQYFYANKKRVSNMDYETYKSILRKLPSNTIVDFSGFVEPFQNTQAIDMMEYTHENGYEETLFTTLRGVNRSIAKRLIEIPFSMVVLHLADKEGYCNIPVTDEYLYVLEMIIRARKRDGMPFVRSANCHGTVHPVVQKVIEGHVVINGEMMDRAGNLTGESGLIPVEKKNGRIRCIRSRELNHNVLLPDGTVVLCCNDYGMKHILGNLKEQSYDEIMRGQTISIINSKMRKCSKDDLLCRRCIYAIED